MSFGPCLCGDLACPSCGPAQGAPVCYQKRVRCGDPECECAEFTERPLADAEPDWDYPDDEALLDCECDRDTEDW